MDDLEIKIAITYKVPERGLTLTGLLRGLERDRDEIMRAVLGRWMDGPLVYRLCRQAQRWVATFGRDNR